MPDIADLLSIIDAAGALIDPDVNEANEAWVRSVVELYRQAEIEPPSWIPAHHRSTEPRCHGCDVELVELAGHGVLVCPTCDWIPGEIAP